MTQSDLWLQERQLIREPGAVADLYGEVTAIQFTAVAARVDRIQRQPREDCDAVISFLTVERGMGVTQPGEPLERKFVVRTFGFLKTDHIGPCGLEKF